MEKNRIPVFKKGKILNKEMLDELRDLGQYFTTTLYLLYSDGVIYGITPTVRENKVIIHSGLIKFGSEIFKIERERELEIPLEDGEYVGFLEKIKLEENDNFRELSFKIDVCSKEEFEDGKKFELFRIMRREGANLKEMQKFLGLAEEYNTLNLINMKQATKSGESISEKLLKNYASNMLKYKELTSEEKIICLYILNSNYEREFILGYLELENEVSNLEIYKALEQKYINAKNKNIRETIQRYDRKRMLVD